MMRWDNTVASRLSRRWVVGVTVAAAAVLLAGVLAVVSHPSRGARHPQGANVATGQDAATQAGGAQQGATASTAAAGGTSQSRAKGAAVTSRGPSAGASQTGPTTVTAPGPGPGAVGRGV